MQNETKEISLSFCKLARRRPLRLCGVCGALAAPRAPLQPQNLALLTFNLKCWHSTSRSSAYPSLTYPAGGICQPSKLRVALSLSPVSQLPATARALTGHELQHLTVRNVPTAKIEMNSLRDSWQEMFWNTPRVQHALRLCWIFPGLACNEAHLATLVSSPRSLPFTRNELP